MSVPSKSWARNPRNEFLTISMSKALAIDYGKKRCGIAITDDQRIIASGLTTVETTQLFDFLEDYFDKNDVGTIVIGEPKRLDGTDSHVTEDVRKVRHLIESMYAKDVVMIDERFTSKMASQAILDSGVKKKDRQNKELVDEVSATIILQSYLESIA